MSFGGTLVIRNMLKIALAILASLVKFQDCLHCLEARTDFVFCLQLTHDHCVWFLHFFPKFRVDTKFRSWLCFVKQFALWLRRDVFRHQHGEFFFHAVNLLSFQFIFGRSLPCVQQHQAMCCFNHNRFGFNIFASNTDQKCNCCLLTVQRSDAILVGLFAVPTRVCVIKVACSVLLCNYRLCVHAMHYHRLDNIHFLNSNWWDIIVTCSFKMTSRGNHTTHHWSAVDQTKI